MKRHLPYQQFILLTIASLGLCSFPLLMAKPAYANACAGQEIEFQINQLRQADEQRRLSMITAWSETYFQFPQETHLVCTFIRVMNDGTQPLTIRRSAMNALGGIGTGAEQAIPHLIAFLENANESPEMRRGAILTLRRIDARGAIPALANALHDPDFGVRIYSVEALASISDKTKVKRYVPELIERLKSDSDSYVRSSVAIALSHISPHDPTVIAALTEALQDPSWFVRKDAATGLSNIGADAAPGVAYLREALKDKNRTLRAIAALTLGTIGGAAKPAIPDLLQALNDPSLFVRRNAAEALGRIGADDHETIQALIHTLDDESADVRDKAIHALRELAPKLGSQLARGDFDLDQAILYLEDILKRLHNPDLHFDPQDIQDVEGYLNTLKNEKYKAQLLNRVVKNPWLWLVLGYGITHLSVFWFRPLWLLKLDEWLKPFSIPLPLAGMKVSAQWFVWGKTHPKVLDAWVELHSQIAQETFSQKPTVGDRHVHVPIPVVLNGHAVGELTGETLRKNFKKHLLICGEGGSGKTSLACEIVRWAMADDVDKRLAPHKMLPILLEKELPLRSDKTPAPLMTAIKGQLEDLTNTSEPISDEWLAQLLKKRRLLVIVDHLSEMSEATREQIHPDLPEFIINALIVTSRDENSISEVNRSVLQPIRIEGNHISAFMGAYLTQVGKRDLFTDAEFFAACSRLSDMVGRRNITPLLAKLYAEELIAAKVNAAKERTVNLPTNIPDLMLSYLNELNRDVHENKLDDRTIQRDAEVAAWACLKENYVPTCAMKDEVVAELEGEDAEKRLNYLEHCLHLIQTVSPEENQIRFALDPLAEYLAGLYLIHHLGADGQAWKELLINLRAIAPSNAALGFVMAVADCCINKGKTAHIPPFVSDELNRLKPA